MNAQRIARTTVGTPKRVIYDGRPDVPPIEFDTPKTRRLRRFEKMFPVEHITDQSYGPLPGGGR